MFGQKVFRKELVAAFLVVFLVSTFLSLQQGFSKPVESLESSSLAKIPAEQLAAISSSEIRSHLSFLASPELEGRYTFSSGNKIAARYLASQLQFYGYRGAAKDGSYMQKIVFASKKLDSTASHLAVEQGSKFGFGDDFFTPEPSAVDLESEVVFLGYGISSPSIGYDDYEGFDLKGKIALILGGFPKNISGYKDEERFINAAKAHGARAVLVLPESLRPIKWGQLAPLVTEPPEIFTEKRSLEVSFPYFFLNPNAAKELLATSGIDFEQLLQQVRAGEKISSKQLSKKVSLKVVMQQIKETTQNVAGIYEGSDPRLKNEYILLSAHYDHLESSNGTIYPGADDDGSGVSALLAIARSLATGERPKRSIIVVFHTAEEIGLFGSLYFTDYEPLVPLKSIIANLNMDMIGRSRSPNQTSTADKELADKDSLYVIGSDKHSTEVHKLSEQTNQEVTGFHLDYRYNDESHYLQLFYRSDHYNYARHAIPIIFYFTGLHADYHQPSDTIEKIDFDKLTKVAKLIYATAWRLANLSQRPVVDLWKSAAISPTVNEIEVYKNSQTAVDRPTKIQRVEKPRAGKRTRRAER
ncbi:MAG: M20/M25/M40 family metallo-hydrolase [Blastocatellia bacterium]|nr:M20/M25/M40 family metallo-hydrolase [Blastocatellia bacterium]